MGGLDPDSRVTTTRTIFYQFGHFCLESAPLHKLKKSLLLLLVVQDIEGSFTIFSILFIPALREVFFWGGGSRAECILNRGVAEMRAICVQGGRGGPKRPKNCVHTISMAPYEDRRN